ncbi:MAG: hypothetical protein Ta2G_22070 [Termitinemataceae bacterium]|nr:MAG: hypothetical protein Ta2G_22070 [Termitinemataceae bacterium]
MGDIRVATSLLRKLWAGCGATSVLRWRLMACTISTLGAVLAVPAAVWRTGSGGVGGGVIY